MDYITIVRVDGGGAAGRVELGRRQCWEERCLIAR